MGENLAALVHRTGVRLIEGQQLYKVELLPKQQPMTDAALVAWDALLSVLPPPAAGAEVAAAVARCLVMAFSWHGQNKQEALISLSRPNSSVMNLLRGLANDGAPAAKAVSLGNGRRIWLSGPQPVCEAVDMAVRLHPDDMFEMFVRLGEMYPGFVHLFNESHTPDVETLLTQHVFPRQTYYLPGEFCSPARRAPPGEMWMHFLCQPLDGRLWPRLAADWSMGRRSYYVDIAADVFDPPKPARVVVDYQHGYVPEFLICLLRGFGARVLL